MGGISWTGALLFVVCTTSSALFLGCQGSATRDNSTASSKIVKARTAMGADAVEVKDLDDPANPYHDQYREWDRWVFAHIVPAPKAWKQGDYPDNWDSLSAEVDQDGYMIPMLESTRLNELAICEGKQAEYSSNVYFVYGEGELPKEIADGFVEMANGVRAGFVPPIPTWLVECPPVTAMLFPNGDVITLSELGDSAKGCCTGEKRTWYRYNNAGELTGQSDVTWWEIYYSERHGKDSWPDGELVNRMDGFVYFKDRATGQVTGYWDYDGTQLESKVPPPFRDPHPFMYLNRNLIVLFYECQHGGGH